MEKHLIDQVGRAIYESYVANGRGVISPGWDKESEWGRELARTNAKAAISAVFEYVLSRQLCTGDILSALRPEAD